MKNVEAKIRALKRAAAPFVNGKGKTIPDNKIRALANAIVELIREV